MLDRSIWIPFPVLKKGIVPLCVLNEWIQTLGTSLPQLQGSIYQFIIDNNTKLSCKKDTDFAYLAQFINPSITSWKKNTLLQVWDRIKLTLEDKSQLISCVEKAIPSLKAGMPTPDSMDTLPLSLLFAYCLEKNIYIPAQVTPDKLVHYITLAYFSKDIQPGMSKALSTLIQASPMHWINAWNFLMDRYQEPVFFSSNLQKDIHECYYEKWQSKLYAIERYEPTTQIDAILCSAMHFGIDISHSQFPIKEYTSLVLSIKEHTHRPRIEIWGNIQYTHPVDIRLEKWILSNPNALSLSSYYNPIFPLEIYPQDKQQHLAIVEGKNANLETMHMLVDEFLLSQSYSSTFRLGMPFEPLNELTPIKRDSIYEVDSKQIICYGSFSTGWTVYTWDEFFEFFSAVRDFKNPSDSTKLIDEIALYKLKLLSQTHSIELFHLMEQLKEEKKTASLQGSQFIAHFYKQDKFHRESIIRQLWALIYLCMTMRCEWDGLPPDSLESLDIQKYFTLKEYPVKDQSRIDYLVSHWMSFFYDHLKTPNILDLPLQNYLDGQFLTSKEIDQGLTIGQRLDIIRENKTIYACLRVSSNWLLSTSYFYLTKLGVDMPFELHQMQRIS